MNVKIVMDHATPHLVFEGEVGSDWDRVHREFNDIRSRPIPADTWRSLFFTP